jgi:hypothetical protein
MNMYLIVQAAFYSYCLPPSKSYTISVTFFPVKNCIIWIIAEQVGLSMCPKSNLITAKMKEIEGAAQGSSSPSISLQQRVFGFLAPLSFAFLMCASHICISFSIYTIPLFFPLPFHNQITTHRYQLQGIHLWQTSIPAMSATFVKFCSSWLPTCLSGFLPSTVSHRFKLWRPCINQSGKTPSASSSLVESHFNLRKQEYNASVAKLKQISEEIWLHYFMFAIILSNATPLIPLIFIIATVAIISTHVLLFAIRERATFAANLLKKIEPLVANKIPYLEVATSLGLIADLFTPYRSLFATFMYFWVFQRQRLVSKSQGCDTRQAWLKVHEKVAPVFDKLPLFRALYPKLVQLAAKFANPQGVAFKQ